jgi:hypothetical protein
MTKGLSIDEATVLGPTTIGGQDEHFVRQK